MLIRFTTENVNPAGVKLIRMVRVGVILMMLNMKKKKKINRWKYVGTVLFRSLVYVFFALATIGGFVNFVEVITDLRAAVWKQDVSDGLLRIDNSTPMYPEEKDKEFLSEKELSTLFPSYKSDWLFVQELVGAKNILFPKVRYQTKVYFENTYTFGNYSSDPHEISLNREIFTAATVGFERNTLLHEMYHAAYSKRYGALENDEAHCEMYERDIFIKLGERAGNRELGEQELKQTKLQ